MLSCYLLFSRASSVLFGINTNRHATQLEHSEFLRLPSSANADNADRVVEYEAKP